MYIQEDYLLFLQDMFPYLEKYLVTDYLPKLAERIEYVMKQDTHSYCGRALLLDYKAELFLIKNDYKNALKKRLKAVSILEPYHTEDADQRTANLLSNLYNNLSNTYLLMKKTKEAAEMLHTALTIRQEYVHLGLAESHDMLQQLLNLTNMLILSKNTDIAKQVLASYENLVLEHEGTQTLDNGVCQMMYGAIALSEGNAKEHSMPKRICNRLPDCIQWNFRYFFSRQISKLDTPIHSINNILCTITVPSFFTPKYSSPLWCLFRIAAIENIASFSSPILFLYSICSVSEPIFTNATIIKLY